jgi:hypothetical protein
MLLFGQPHYFSAEGTKAYINAVFGPKTGQKLHKLKFFVPSAEYFLEKAVQKLLFGYLLYLFILLF